MNEHIVDLIRSKSCKPYDFYLHHEKYPDYLKDYEVPLEILDNLPKDKLKTIKEKFDDTDKIWFKMREEIKDE